MFDKYLRRLNPRDRNILLWATPAVVLLLVLLAARPLMQQQGQTEEELNLVLEDIAWLQAQADALAAVDRNCSRSGWSDTLPDRLAARYEVTVSRLPAGAAAVELAIEAGHGNQVLAYLRELECRGARVEELVLETVDDRGSVKGQAALLTPVT